MHLALKIKNFAGIIFQPDPVELHCPYFHSAMDNDIGTCFVDPRFVFLDLKALFDTVDRGILWRYLGMPKKFIPLILSLYANSRNQVYGYVAPEFSMKSYGCSAIPI